MTRCASWPVLAAVLATAWFAGCAAEQEANCDQLLANENYERVVKTCEDPAQIAMGYLGLAGFSFIDFLVAEDASNINALLGVNATNASTKRELINSAVRTVGSPSSTRQAFLLLLSAYLGMSVTLSEYLDNGAGSSTAFDGSITDEEIEDATGLAVQDPTPPVSVSISPGADFSVEIADTPYVVVCADAGPVFCDGAVTTVYDDVTPVAGAGLDDGSVNGSPPDLSTAEQANQMAMLVDFELAIAVDDTKFDKLQSFLAEGTLDPDYPIENPDLFPIGLLGYLNLLDLANLMLVSAAGGNVEEDEPADSTLNNSIDQTREVLDNGAFCFSDGSSAARDAAAIPLNVLYAIYESAPGTDDLAVPDPEVYTDYNVVSADDLTGIGVPTINAADYVFGQAIGYKMLYPLTIGGGFDRTNATPRIDQTPESFQEDFNLVPQLAPDAAGLLNGRVTMAELICISES